MAIGEEDIGSVPLRETVAGRDVMHSQFDGDDRRRWALGEWFQWGQKDI